MDVREGWDPVPVGKVKWFDDERGFGFLVAQDGEEVFLHASALPDGVTTVKPGSKVEFDVADGRKGKQALAVRLTMPPPSVAAASRKEPEDMVVIVEDVIRLLDGVSGALRRGRYPDQRQGAKVASVLRVVADELDA